LFQGAPDPATGHAIVVASDVTPAVVCPAPNAPDPKAMLGPMDCIGHSSVTGIADNPDTGTSVMLSKDGVDLMSTQVEAISPAVAPNNVYAICAPGDTYDLQRLEAVVPAAGVVPMAREPPVAIGTPQMIALPTAAPTSSGCPTTCSSAAGVCPGICANVVATPLAP
jgi:hypothetical protein